MESDTQTDALHAFGSKDKMEQRLAVGMHGVPEWKRDEKILYLGEFRERIIRRLTKKQIGETGLVVVSDEAVDVENIDVK